MARPKPLPRDEDLIRRTLAGETQAFNTLVERYFGMVFILAISRVRERETAEDLAQEIFLRAFLHLRELRQPRHFSAWITRIARNLGSSWAQRRQRSSRLVPMIPLKTVERTTANADAKGVREAMEARQRNAALDDALQTLSPDQRDLVLLRYAEDLTQQEIAERLGVNQATVSRQIRRALDQMRGHLEDALRESAPRFRAPTRAVTRTATIIAAAGIMSASAKTAVVAAAQGSGAAVKGGGMAAGVSSLLQSVPAMFAAGGSAMGFGKAVAAVVAVGTVAGGLCIYTESRSETPPEGSPSVQAAPALDTTAPPPNPSVGPPPPDWATWIQQFARETPGNEGLLALADAAQRFNMAAMLPGAELDALLDNGWRTPSPDMMNRMRAQGPALESAARAAMAENIDFPPLMSHRDPVPNFLALQTIVKLICVDARRLESMGNLDAAAQRAAQAARLSEHLIEDDVSLIQNLIGVAGLSVSFKTLEAILAHPRLTEETARAVGRELARLDSVRTPASALLAADARLSFSTVQGVISGEIEPGTGQSESDIRTFIGGDFDVFATAHERLWSDVAANLGRPFWEREPMDEAWVRQRSPLPIHALSTPNLIEATIRWEVAWAHGNLCRTLASLRDGIIRGTDWVAMDSFDGQPIRVAEDRVWSVGPDMRDQQGRTEYDSANGTTSAGDIVARR